MRLAQNSERSTRRHQVPRPIQRHLFFYQAEIMPQTPIKTNSSLSESSNSAMTSGAQVKIRRRAAQTASTQTAEQHPRVTNRVSEEPIVNPELAPLWVQLLLFGDDL